MTDLERTLAIRAAAEDGRYGPTDEKMGIPSAIRDDVLWLVQRLERELAE